MNVAIPMISTPFYAKEKTPQLKSALAIIAKRYYSAIRLTERLTKVPGAIILSIIFAESAGYDIAISSSGAVGLMQLKPQTAHDTLVQENNFKRLSTTEKNILKKQLGARLDSILAQQYLGQKLKSNNYSGNVITKADLLNPEFNILVGSIYLGLLIDQHEENGTLRLDKVVLRYNQGYFYKPKGNTVKETLVSAKKRSEEAYAYVLKVVGKNGLLEAQV
ncbi:MAG: transglycosylase SLT domain-containing protein [Sphingobacteriales bacterium]|nr:transglycosylase SLT domain-containing protein [Sphingobacteriales bacterium]